MALFKNQLKSQAYIKYAYNHVHVCACMASSSQLWHTCIGMHLFVFLLFISLHIS